MKVDLQPHKRAALYLRVSTARQASQGGESEGYSIPAQRAACQRKAADLGADVVDEYVDAGASARSADRPALQELLARLQDTGDIDYVIVHKVDRLARDRADDVAIGLTIHKAGAVLVSASEQIDDTPAGTLLHGIMATIAEFYSKNLSHEAKKGLHEKARRGGTPSYAPLGYLNARKRVDEREVKTIELDPERAPHIRWAFETYASGSLSITELVEELDKRGLRTRPTPTRIPKPLTRSQVHRILSSPYYIGKLVYGGVTYDAVHEPLVSGLIWQQTRDVLAGRRISGDRGWKHDHYLKGTVYCGQCHDRLGASHSTSSSGKTYPYFYCIGRNKKRTECELTYMPLDTVEGHVLTHWATRMRLAKDIIGTIRESVEKDFTEKQTEDEILLRTQRSRLRKLEARRQKLIEAYLAEAIPVADLKQRQEANLAEQHEAERLIEAASANYALIEQRLDTALQLLERCDQLYLRADDKHRRAYNQAFFERLEVTETGVTRMVLNEPWAELHDRSIGLLDDEDELDDDAPDGGADGPDMKNAADPDGARRRSNVDLLAEGEGFEPSRSVNP